MTRPDETLAPSRRARRGVVAPTVLSDYDEAEVARGTAAAVLGALGRMQLKLDVLAKEQAEVLARLEARIVALDQRLTELTVEEVEA
ncbi:MAG: hypothetical protein JWN87_461 [Frankiales bacterium]|jgi:hypothetical protein|nr:hypothetical protein [Frankiales bacterium]